MTFLLLTFPALAASPKEELEETQRNMEASQARAAQLEKEAGKISGELEDIQRQLVRLADAVQKSESELSAAEEKLRVLTGEIFVKKEELAVRQKHLSALIQAALRLSHMPPEAMVVMPGDVGENIKVARALKMAAQNIRHEIDAINIQVAELGELEAKLKERRDSMALRAKQLVTERKNLQGRMAERKELQKKLGARQKQEAEKIAQLARKADDLRDLVDTTERPRDAAPPAGQKDRLRSFTRAKGHIRSPVTGSILEAFGTADGKGGNSKGVVVGARSGAQVVAPFDGEVVFTGPFLNYGRMVIIRHSDDFHTLLAGLSRIDTAPGEFLLEGEPIGAMGNKASGNRLYVELRKNNQPINPNSWMRELNSKP